MGEHSKTKAFKGEFHLPEPIIHRIQSFLTGKEAARTTILSKSWHSAWLTRPNLNFDVGDFNPVFSKDDSDSSDVSDSSVVSDGVTSSDLESSDDSDSDNGSDNDSDGERNNDSDNDSSSDSDIGSSSDSDNESDSDCGHVDSKNDEFLEFADMTIQRYEQSNLKIERLSLRVRKSYSCSYGSNPAHDLIVRALRIGATHLSFQIDYGFVLPREVFESGNLIELSVEGGKLDLGIDRKVICRKLESLSLRKLKIQSGIISEIISSCPLIKKLSLSSIRGFDCRIVRLINLPKSHKLISCLVLCKVKFDISFLADLSSNFPSLEDLTIDSCGNVREICSHSLLRLTIIAQVYLKKVNVPRIQKFTFEGSYFPPMSFETTSREWESHVSINCKRSLSTLWFSGLKRILTELRRSKIHLSLSLCSDKSLYYKPENIHDLSKCQVETLTMDLFKLPYYKPENIHGLSKCQVETLTMDLFKLPSSICYALFDGLFRLCRPKFVTHELYPENISTCEVTNNDFLCKTLVRGMNGEFSSPSKLMHGVHGLEKVKMELYDEDVAAWRPRPLESLLDGSTSPKEKQNVRFQLKWKL